MSAVEVKVKVGELDAYASGLRRAVLAPSDLDVEVGDSVILREYDDASGVYVGPWVSARSTHVERFGQRLGGRRVELLVISLDLTGKGIAPSRQRRVGEGEDAVAA